MSNLSNLETLRQAVISNWKEGYCDLTPLDGSKPSAMCKANFQDEPPYYIMKDGTDLDAIPTADPTPVLRKFTFPELLSAYERQCCDKFR